MASTTLITFMLQAPTTVFSVEILGSWDNFSKPYQLKRDRKTGPGQWRGCHTFENITCDGDTLSSSTSRNGGLKMGGTYWYYYVLDGDIEYHDPVEPSTNLCPLLPGQMVNVLDVPVQGEVPLFGSRNLSSSSLDFAVFTLDPKDKYLSPGVRRATTTSAVHALKARLPVTTKPTVRVHCSGSTRAEVAPQTSDAIEAMFTLERRNSLLSVFHRMRQTRSADSNTKSSPVWPHKILSQAGQPTEQDATYCIPETAKLPDCAPNLLSTRIGDEFELPIQLPSATGSTDRAPTVLTVNSTEQVNKVCPLELPPLSASSQSALPNEIEQGREDGFATPSVRSFETSFLSKYYTPFEQLKDTLTYFAPTSADDKNDKVLNDHLGRLNLAPVAEETLTEPTKVLLDEQTAVPNMLPSLERLGSLELDFHSPQNGYAESLASYTTSANFSPWLASNTTHSGPMSPYHLSQPETPVMSGIEDDLLLPPLRRSGSLGQMGRSIGSDLDLPLAEPSSGAAPPHLPRWKGVDTQTSHASPVGFEGYSLPDHTQASVPTIRKSPSVAIKKTDAQQDSKQDLIHSWNDGSQHRVTALGELVDDLGYLGGMII